MATEPKPVTSDTANAPASRGTATPVKSAAPAPITSDPAPTQEDGDDDTVKVRSLKHHRIDINDPTSGKKPGDEFEVPRNRAVQLRASGIVEYTSNKDAEHEAVRAGKQASDAVRQRDAEYQKELDAQKTTPLKQQPILTKNV